KTRSRTFCVLLRAVVLSSFDIARDDPELVEGSWLHSFFMSSTQVAVIGAGPGGYAAAFLAADLGLSVALIDPDVNPGGACVYRGCIPSKALLHVAKLLDESRHAKAWGIEFGDPKIDLDRLRGFKDAVVRRLTGGTGQLVKIRKVQYLQGRA